MRKTARLVGSVVAVVVISAGVVRSSRHAQPPRGAFYYWQTRWTSAAAQSEALRAPAFDRLYLRFFDVALDQSREHGVPLAPLELEAPLPPGITVVPVVFLQNDVLRAKSLDVAALGRHIREKVAGMAATSGIDVRELQIDCDWTVATKSAYFQLLAALRAPPPSEPGSPAIALSATIRLHQVKYPEKTGVPPVDRGMLMFYNIGAIGADRAKSSIFDADDAGRYVAAVEQYPLPLDVALPLFSWAIHQRSGQVVDLIESVPEAAFAHSEAFQPDLAGAFRAVASAFFRGRYFRKDDLVRFETVTPELTRSAAKLAASHQPSHRPFRTVAFFDLNPGNLTRYETSFFKRTLALFE